ncbi:MAG: element excision factor XisH family protein [Armatimonadota bacterium]
MPALDRYHNAVVQALIKDGWTITDNPLRLTLGERSVMVDVGAERVLAAEKGPRRIAVEIKTFSGPSLIADLQQAVGQFGMYEDVLAVVEPERELFLAIPSIVQQTLVSEEIGRLMLEHRIRRIISFSVSDQEIVQWIPPLT